jgi:hypothetical protein
LILCFPVGSADRRVTPVATSLLHSQSRSGRTGARIGLSTGPSDPGAEDCFVASLRAMAGGASVAGSRMLRARGLSIFRGYPVMRGATNVSGGQLLVEIDP